MDATVRTSACLLSLVIRSNVSVVLLPLQARGVINFRFYSEIGAITAPFWANQDLSGAAVLAERGLPHSYFSLLPQEVLRVRHTSDTKHQHSCTPSLRLSLTRTLSSPSCATAPETSRHRFLIRRWPPPSL